MEKSSRNLGQVIYHCWKQLHKNVWDGRISVTFSEFPAQDKTVLLSFLLFLHFGLTCMNSTCWKQSEQQKITNLSWRGKTVSWRMASNNPEEQLSPSCHCKSVLQDCQRTSQHNTHRGPSRLKVVHVSQKHRLRFPCISAWKTDFKSNSSLLVWGLFFFPSVPKKTIGWFRLERIFEGHLAQLSANSKCGTACSGSCPAELWASPRMEIPTLVWATIPMLEHPPGEKAIYIWPEFPLLELQLLPQILLLCTLGTSLDFPSFMTSIG